MKGHSRNNSSLIGRKHEAKCENYCVSRNGHRTKITQRNSMILVSFSSAEDALFNDIKYGNFRSQGTEHPPFRFLGHPVYIIIWQTHSCILPEARRIHQRDSIAIRSDATDLSRSGMCSKCPLTPFQLVAYKSKLNGVATYSACLVLRKWGMQFNIDSMQYGM